MNLAVSTIDRFASLCSHLSRHFTFLRYMRILIQLSSVIGIQILTLLPHVLNIAEPECLIASEAAA